MSIAADIEAITETPEGYRLELAGRLYRNPDGKIVGTVPPGQRSLTILDPTWRPEVGMSIWGGSSSVIIEANPKRVYDRVGYIYLCERGPP